MSEIETLTEDGIVVLAALRDAAALRREPTAAAKDGYQKMFALTALVAEGRIGGDTMDSAAIGLLDRAARGLYKKHLVVKRTIFSKVFYGITDEGTALLARIEEAAGVAGLVAAKLAHEQSIADVHLVNKRLRETRDQLTAAIRESGTRDPLTAVLDSRRSRPLGLGFKRS